MGSVRPNTKVGDVLGGKYRVDRILGAGGVGVIAAGVHVELGQKVAIKLLRADVNQELKDRFMREARAAARLSGEHVARVMDVGRSHDGTPYFVMELLSGEDLGQLLARSGPMHIETAVGLALQVCEGLAEAHAQGIVHRDLKPRNLFLTRRVHGDALVKILDFGIAKIREPADKTETSTESVFGSPQYMSPEQMRASRNVDARSDVWSLGVCLYELLTGQAPFDAPTVPLLCVKVLTEAPPPLREKRPDVPEELAQVIARCLSKEPEGRYADVAELAAALEPFAPSARGSTDRVLAVLHAPPRSIPPEPFVAQDAIGDTRTAGSFDTGGERKSRTTLLAAVVVGALVMVTGAASIAIMHTRTAPAAGASALDHAPASAVTSGATSTMDAPTIEAIAVENLPAVQAPSATKSAPTTVKHQPKKPDAGVNPSQRF